MKYHDFAEVLRAMQSRFPDRPALEFERDGERCSLTYTELSDMVFAKAESLEKEPCHCVGVYLPASPAWVVTVMASAIAGKRTVLLDPMLTKDQLQVLVYATGVDKLVSYEPETTDSLHLCDTPEGEIECGGHLLFFTSGTTSRNKAVVLSQEALCSSAWNGQQCLPCDETDKVLCGLPLNHVFGFVCALFWPLNNGACVAFSRGIRSLMADPKYFHPTILSVVPAILNYLLAADALNPELRCILVGASPCDENAYHVVTEMGLEIRCGYGLTETASGLAMTPKGGGFLAMDLCPDTKVRIAEDGEVCIRTTCMMDGYYHDPASTGKVLVDGELHTGDLGELDADGHLYILGRKNDVLVLQNGEKVYCAEAEQELSDVLGYECGMFLRDGKLILAAGACNKEQADLWPKVEEWNRSQPMGKRVAKLIVSREPLPKTATGKLQRWKLATLA